MYLHLGQYTVVRTRDIVGIFDIENSSVSRFTKDYLAQAQKRGWVVNVSAHKFCAINSLNFRARKRA